MQHARCQTSAARFAGAAPCRYKNMDKFIHHVNLDGRVNAFYSTPAAYVDAKHSFNASWPLKTDDFFPYADCPSCMWTGDRFLAEMPVSTLCHIHPATQASSLHLIEGSCGCAGYFVSRAASKGYIKQGTSYLQVARQMEFLTDTHGYSDALEEAVALLQHHDSITGTEKQHVANDYHLRLASGTVSKPQATLLCLAYVVLTAPPGCVTMEEVWYLMASAIAAKLSSWLAAGWTQAERFVSKALSHLVYNTPTGSHSRRQARLQPPAAKEAGEDLLLLLKQCQQLNVSACESSVKASQKDDPFLVVVYNPLAWPRTAAVRVPVVTNDSVSWHVKGPPCRRWGCRRGYMPSL